jgi:hypothetical protein
MKPDLEATAFGGTDFISFLFFLPYAVGDE